MAAITQELAGQESGDMLDLAQSYASKARSDASRDKGLGDYYAGGGSSGGGSGTGGGSGGGIGGGWTPPGGGGGWHTHPNVGSDGFSLGDYQHRQRRFVSYQRGPYASYGTSLKYYDGFAAWDEFGGMPSPAVELPESIAVKHVECIKGFCL